MSALRRTALLRRGRASAAIIRSCPRANASLAALTFDDGPSVWTGPILDLLAEHDARATFFVLGLSVAGNEDLVRRIVAEGHELGNHTQSHLDPAAVSDELLVAEITAGAETIAAACGSRPQLARPPYGGDPRRFARAARRAGSGPVILWSVDPADWRRTDAAPIVDEVLGQIQPGAIVDLHDGMPPNSSGAASRQATVDAVALLLPALGERGYRPVTVSELITASQ